VLACGDVVDRPADRLPLDRSAVERIVQRDPPLPVRVAADVLAYVEEPGYLALPGRQRGHRRELIPQHLRVDRQPRAPHDPHLALVCAAADVPANGMKEFPVNGVSVLIVNAGAAFVAYQALCPHEAVPLEQGIHDGCVLTCLEHM
jgi:Rieske [2Fe-2S] domain